MAHQQPNPFRLLHQRPPQSSEGWVLDIVPSLDRAIVAAPTAGGTIKIFDANNLSEAGSINIRRGNADSTISEVVFDTTNNALLWSADKGGAVGLWDLRSGAQALSHDGVEVRAPVLSLSVNSNHTLLAAGTELVGDDAKILFWDVRNGLAPLAEFIECHSDDVTQVRFHPEQPNAMMSGSTDGLVCLYNLETFDEDDALYQVIKEDSVHKIGYFGPSYEYLYCLTHMETFSLWQFSEAERVYQFGDIRMQTPEAKVDYLIDCAYDAETQRMYLLSGSQE
ncbi:WD repeat-containing protein 89 [Rhizophlyctis rosea]|uniref:WD repeat-containing protein 89 n=1 Tax=Rhizophlyctis rosea TaxID=64517 RepID=A0AAD5S507_9FUNG|nr:WD repeat-containing protein 89 [Rhizophlyctis rosea]